ncbi:MAG: ester cyclase [Ktedonobacterales bacterium]|nr:ester cyclase [Ktedonobacterales bacterium]
MNERNQQVALDFLERVFNQGDLDAISQLTAADGVDHQEPPGTDFQAHLREVTTRLRTAFPDLRFTVHTILSDGDTVAFRSTMTGTHLGPLQGLPPTGRAVSVAHMHFIRVVEGRGHDLWHVWDIPGMMRQLGAGAPSAPASR